MEEVKRFERRRSIETRKERSPRVEEKESTMVEAKKVTRRKEEELLIVEEQRRPVISSPHSGFPTGISSRKLYLFQFPSFCKAPAKIVFPAQETKENFQISLWPKTVQSRPV